ELGGPPARMVNAFQTISKFTIRGKLGQQGFAVTENDRQEIVKVMRNASGQPADSFHSLGYLELLFLEAESLIRPLTLRQILGDADETNDAGALVEYGRRAQ